MAGSQKPGPLGKTSEAQDLNDGTLVRRLSALPVSIGSKIVGSRLRPVTSQDYISRIYRLFERLRKAASGEELQRVAVALLGSQCFSAGVIAGIGLDIINSATDLLKLVRTFVLADFHDISTEKLRWYRYIDPFIGTRLLSAKIAKVFFADELREAAEERDALVKELSEAIKDPGAFFEGMAYQVVESYQKDWQEFQAHMSANTLEGRFKAGMILGPVLLDILSLLTGIAGAAKGAAKVATKLPRLVKYAGKVKLKPGVGRKSRISSSRGGSSGAPQGPPQKPAPAKTQPVAKAKLPPKTVGHRRVHILNRHKHGANKPRKTEFPKEWSDDDIMRNIESVANDPNAKRVYNEYGSTVIGTRDGMEIRVDFFPDDHPTYPGHISTGFPINVPANPAR